MRSSVGGVAISSDGYFLFSDLAVIAAKSENKKGFLTSEKARISSRVLLFFQMVKHDFVYKISKKY